MTDGATKAAPEPFKAKAIAEMYMCRYLLEFAQVFKKIYYFYVYLMNRHFLLGITPTTSE